ncbi:SPOR domain-containing protein [Altererythrobacter arenosus]|uniref:SPOR domain-containing protein n=1 Tax=Altererythrobacter arenosus TaxID=3032592 RepID=A0ABY8FQE6_9SPHN|nr:SPOR domain-containing protein [Altererythrobacter sp. CAU 1644]WFL77072.1 SPOR domain-containing protein [Altererythrobacter sp. CAU 1644]
MIGGAPRAEAGKPTTQEAEQVAANGPAADYPVVLGEPYKIDGLEYVPADTWNYDEVGYATADVGEGVTVSHKTLPLPSYVEVTSLESGKTVLMRVERRGPLTNAHVVGLSAQAQSVLGASESTPVRIRRVNPPEAERALLRAGEPASDRLDMPMSLVTVLLRKLPASGTASLAAAKKPAEPSPTESSPATEVPRIAIEDVTEVPAPEAKPAGPSVARIEATPLTERTAPVAGGFVIQAAAFSSKENAEKAAKTLKGFVDSSGKLFRVRTGPYTSRGQADAALAKVKAAGYSDARVIKAG